MSLTKFTSGFLHAAYWVLLVSKKQIVSASLILTFISISTSVQAQQDKYVANFGRWTVECKLDRMTDKRGCSINLKFSSTDSGPFINGSLATTDLGETFYVGTYPYAILVEMRVDKTPAHGAQCATLGCTFGGDDGQRLGRELAGGSKLLLRVVTSRANLEQEIPISTFPRAVAEAKNWIAK